MSSLGRKVIPISLAVALGIWNGYYAFSPALKEQQKESEPITQNGQQPDKTIHSDDFGQQKSSNGNTSLNR
ncbi:uncharacterized protein F4822DRAFT_402999 [Hypoxylon trugodes]|uniref:uncharacterized protein n=1 Tax=Hypoxylon trugodes TaxID=326681 RepID=UPI00218EF870|nr:uncharacterized protein F4822DRAFT_402999 [Hypoxylon trugodes]KAI1388502.1 hypothetical protein F4822DRAFT_402999 [Hypoxylon trugodes]